MNDIGKGIGGSSLLPTTLIYARQAAVAVQWIACVGSIEAGAFLLHVNLSTAGSIAMLLVLLAAYRSGLVQASVVSVTAVLCLNYLFTKPVFTFTVADPQNWVSLFTFEATALLVSGLASRVRTRGAQVEQQRERAVKLYELGRAILLIDQHRAPEGQLSVLIREFLRVEEVEILVFGEIEVTTAERLEDEPERDGTQFSLHQDYDHLEARCSQRILRLGTTAIGKMTLRGWEMDKLTADAAASLAAITVERARAIKRETRAEMERDAERLRTAVLDGLAHAFKTPLTAVQTASSGLLAIGELNATQAELVSIIDERAAMLTDLTTRLLQTAALEAGEIRLRRSNSSIVDLLHGILNKQDEETRVRTIIKAPMKPREDRIDVLMVQVALQQLIDNAAKYSAVYSPIQIEVNQRSFETEVVVQNTNVLGSSIRPEEQTRIFERFYRGVDTVHGPPGTGLGLSIVKKTAEAHGGHASVECSLETTRFIFAIQHHEKESNDKSSREAPAGRG